MHQRHVLSRRAEGPDFAEAFVDPDTVLLVHNQAYRANLDARPRRDAPQQAPVRAVDLAPAGSAVTSFYGPLRVRSRGGLGNVD